MGIYFNRPLQTDNLFVKSEVRNLAAITGLNVRKGLENAIISENEIVNVVSNSYGHLPNENFFNVVEETLINADINYSVRSINRENRSFAADYILSDERYHVNVKNSEDIIKPMLRFTNSYDGSNRTSGSFGFYREVCQNGLHVAKSQIGFKVKHTSGINQIVLPEIRNLVKTFIDNEYFSLQRKFEVLAETPITNVKEWVRLTANELNLFQFEISETNLEPGLNARLVIQSIEQEANVWRVNPNFWLGYNAFNEVIHGKLKKPFEQQKKNDFKTFETIYEMALS